MWGKRMKLIRKIIDIIVPVSRRDMAEIVNILDGLTIANGQQAEMLANLVRQTMELQKKKVVTQEKEKIEYDEAFQ